MTILTENGCPLRDECRARPGLIPGIKCGTGLNLLPLGIMCGLVGAVVAIEYKFSGLLSFLVALAVSIPIAVVVGYLVGLVLNRIKDRKWSWALCGLFHRLGE